MMRRALALALLAAPIPAYPQLIYPPVSGAGGVDQAARDAAAAAQAKADAAATPSSVTSAVSALQSTVMAAIPAPATTVGNPEMVGGAVGTSTAYKRGDWVPPRISRTGTCTLSASGTCSASWTTAFPAGTTVNMIGDPVAVNTTAANPISCNITSAPTISGVAVKCWQAQNTILNLTLITAGLTLSPFAATTLSGVVVTVSAFPVSQ